MVGVDRLAEVKHLLVGQILDAALGGNVWLPLTLVTILGLASLAIATVTFGIFERAARARATLSLT